MYKLYQPLLLAGLLVVATLALYSPVGGFEFTNFDDPEYIASNRHVTAGLTGEGIRWRSQTPISACGIRSHGCRSPLLNSLAWLMATDKNAAWRDGHAAVIFGEQAARATTNQSAEILDTLAAAYAENRQFAEAMKTAQMAFYLAVTSANERLAIEIRQRVEIYRAGRPWRE